MAALRWSDTTAQQSRYGVVGGAHAGDFGNAELLGDEMRRKQHQAVDPMILDAAGIDSGDCGAVAVADENAAVEADGVSTCGSTPRACSSMKLMRRGMSAGLEPL